MIAVHQVPIDEVEQKEKDRVEKLQQGIDDISACAISISENWLENSMEAIKSTLKWISNEPETEDHWQEYLSAAMKAKEKAITDIQSAIEKREKYDAEQAELAALRAAQEEQARKDREREQEERDRKIAEEATKAAEEAARVAKIAEERRVEAARKAELDAAADREKELIEKAERAEKEKLETEQRLKREAEAEKAREAAEAKKREANKKHRASINNAAVDALVTGGIDKEQAKAVITLIAKRMIPNVEIKY